LYQIKLCEIVVATLSAQVKLLWILLWRKVEQKIFANAKGEREREETSPRENNAVNNSDARAWSVCVRYYVTPIIVRTHVVGCGQSGCEFFLARRNKIPFQTTAALYYFGLSQELSPFGG
jgi:hypothetical protein